ncbi:hypothetical protein MRX96_054551 [Rhipicephalus microplus]
MPCTVHGASRVQQGAVARQSSRCDLIEDVFKVQSTPSTTASRAVDSIWVKLSGTRVDSVCACREPNSDHPGFALHVTWWPVTAATVDFTVIYRTLPADKCKHQLYQQPLGCTPARPSQSFN